MDVFHFPQSPTHSFTNSECIEYRITQKCPSFNPCSSPCQGVVAEGESESRDMLGLVAICATLTTSAGSVAACDENGVTTLSPIEFILPPEEIPSLSWRWFRGRTNWVDSTIIGRSQKTFEKRSADLENRCGERWAGRPISSGGLKSGFREFGQQWDYVGIQHTSEGNAAVPPDQWLSWESDVQPSIEEHRRICAKAIMRRFRIDDEQNRRRKAVCEKKHQLPNCNLAPKIPRISPRQ